MIFMFLSLVLVSLTLQVTLFVPAFLLKTDKLTDFTYSLTFIILSLIMYLASDKNPAKITLFLMVLAWGIRLGYYLVKRIWKIGRDKRFDEVRVNFWRFLSFWIFQGLVVPIILLPSIFFFSNEVVISSYLMMGFAVWFFGLLIETIADIQKYNFINNPQNKGKWIDTGLWNTVRHPNYFGEIICWLGIYMYAFSSMSIIEKAFAFASPLTIFVLLVFISGIPILESKANKKWGKNLKYIKYKEKTKALIPFIY